MAITIVTNEKGGCGKTTTASTIATGLARNNREVLAIDLDTQGNLSRSLGIPKAPGLYDWLIAEKKLKDVAFNARPHLDVIRSDKSTARLKVSVAGMDFREYILQNSLSNYQRYWDDVIIDCAPSVDVLHAAAMVAADFMIIPTVLEQFSSEGVGETVNSLMSINKVTKSTCKVAGIIPIKWEGVTRESHGQLKALATVYKGLVWPAVPQDTSCKEAARLGKTLWEYPCGKALAGYEACLEIFLKMI